MTGRSGLLAAGLMLAAAVLAGLDAVIVRLLAGEVHPLVIGFFRALFGLAAVLPWIRRVDLRASPWRWMHVLRAGLKLAALVAVFVAFAHAPLADAMALTFTMPLLVTLGAWVFLGESIGRARLLGALAGFGGVLIVVRPGAGFDPWLLFAFAGAVLTAAIQLMLRHMTHADTTQRLVAWNLIAMVPLGLLAAAAVWTTPSPAQLGLLALQGALGALNMTLITRAFALADVSFLAPLDFLRLPAVAILAWLVFAEVAPGSTWIGAGIIVAASLISLQAGKRQKNSSQERQRY
ncbi:DMT family transporter [Paracoccus sp. TOH]|uniref:DMT family transporter n=1 Tax=Paracoccus sp. TOH TaxID=1263728 RepID=UPI0025B05153|nr:DMT family transporter [Paracoccus sp. TOH]WJS86980.1 DMT family transporter [Paracoccus sp. TOH]